MFNLLSQEITDFITKNNKYCKIVMGSKTFETLGKLHSINLINNNAHVYTTFNELKKVGFEAKYRGISIIEGDFEYGYYLK
jgi:dihydrofolate reductase